MLKVDHISTGYGKKKVLFDVSFEVNEGETVMLTGGNGSGKSTLLKCIYNLLPLWCGAIWFDNERIDGLKTHQMTKAGIVYIPQKDFYFENLTVDENLKISGYTIPKKDLKERISEVYELTSLGRLKKRKPVNLSGGERKILAFGMALLHNPKLLLFDEPFAGVDNNSFEIIKSRIQENFSESKVSILFVEHNRQIEILSKRTIHLYLGKIESY
jgi:branched-chain amino acid transport system ATP-binding protein